MGRGLPWEGGRLATGDDDLRVFLVVDIHRSSIQRHKKKLQFRFMPQPDIDCVPLVVFLK